MIGINPDCPPGVALLADHLDASLAAGEDLLASSLAARADLDEVDPQSAPEALDAFVQRLLQLESSLVLRLLQARRLSVEIARADPTMKSVASLFRAQTDTLHDMIAGAGRTPDGALTRAGDSHAYIRSRGLIAPEAAAPSPFETLSVDESFRVGGVAPLSQILDFASSTLDLLDARFGLYMPDLPDEPSAGAGTGGARERGEARPSPVDSLASALGLVRATANEAATPIAAGADEMAAKTAPSTAKEAPSKLGRFDAARPGAPLFAAEAGSREPQQAAASSKAKEPREEREESEAPRKVDYRSLAERIAEVQRSPDRL